MRVLSARKALVLLAVAALPLPFSTAATTSLADGNPGSSRAWLSIGAVPPADGIRRFWSLSPDAPDPLPNGLREGYERLPQEILALVDAEQTLVNRVMNFDVFYDIRGKHNSLDPRYYPERRPVFYLHTYEIPEDELNLSLSGAVPEQLRFTRDGKAFIRFLVHPESEDLYRKKFGRYRSSYEYLATPLSSHRSLVAWNPRLPGTSPLLVKVSLNKSIGEVVRNLEKEWIDRAVLVSRAFHEIPRRELAARGIHFIDEPVGVVPKSVDAGFQVRSWPFAESRGKTILPMFALYADRQGRSPIIAEMLRKAKAAGEDPRKFLRSRIIQPIVDQALYLALEHGIVGEPHSQNLLLEIGPDGMPAGQVWYRDFGGFGVSRKFREAAGRSFSFLGPTGSWKDVKPRNDGFLADFMNYFNDGNMYALSEAVSREFPELTHEELSREVTASVSRGISAWTGWSVGDLKSGEKALEAYLKHPCLTRRALDVLRAPAQPARD